MNCGIKPWIKLPEWNSLTFWRKHQFRKCSQINQFHSNQSRFLIWIENWIYLLQAALKLNVFWLLKRKTVVEASNCRYLKFEWSEGSQINLICRMELAELNLLELAWMNVEVEWTKTNWITMKFGLSEWYLIEQERKRLK